MDALIFSPNQIRGKTYTLDLLERLKPFNYGAEFCQTVSGRLDWQSGGHWGNKGWLSRGLRRFNFGLIRGFTCGQGYFFSSLYAVWMLPLMPPNRGAAGP